MKTGLTMVDRSSVGSHQERITHLKYDIERIKDQIGILEHEILLMEEKKHADKK